MTGAHYPWLGDHKITNHGSANLRMIRAIGLSCKSNSDTENPCQVVGAGTTIHSKIWSIYLTTTTSKFVSDSTGNEAFMDYDEFSGTVTPTNGGNKSLMIFTNLKDQQYPEKLYTLNGNIV